VIDITTGEDPAQKIVLINPQIVKTEGSQKSEEGCLSLPTFREQVGAPAQSHRRRPGRQGQTIRDGWRRSSGARLSA